MKRLTEKQLKCISGGHPMDWALPEGVTYSQIAPFLNNLPSNWQDYVTGTDIEVNLPEEDDDWDEGPIVITWEFSSDFS